MSVKQGDMTVILMPYAPTMLAASIASVKWDTLEMVPMEPAQVSLHYAQPHISVAECTTNQGSPVPNYDM